MDLMKITSPEFSNEIYSFLAISWGFISDLDIKTEWMRSLGSFRFDLGAVWNIIRKPKYKGRLSFYNEDNKEIVIKNNFIHLWACNTSHASYSTFS